MRELGDLNNSVPERIVSFGMAVVTDHSARQQAVMRRHKRPIESILGQIYAHRGYLPHSVVLDKSISASESIDQEMKDVEVQIRSDLQWNDVL
jgi:hypothetical protein